MTEIWQCLRRVNRGMLCALVAVMAFAAATADAANSVYGSISGTVTYANDHKPVGNVVVGAYQGKSLVATATTTARGTYVLGDLAPNSYRLFFFPASGNGESIWYKNEPSESTANPVKVVAGKRSSGISQALARGGSIIGKVTRRAGAPASEVQIKLYEVTAGSYELYDSYATQAGNPYRLGGLPVGQYILEFKLGGHFAWYAGHGKGSARFRASAEVITVTSSGPVTGINGSPYPTAVG